MTVFRLRYVKAYTDSRGKRRHYFRRPGAPVVALPGEPGSREFMAAYHEAFEAKRTDRGAERWPPRSIGALVAAYYQTAAFKKLKASTQPTYRRDMEALRAKHGRMAVGALKRRHVSAMLDALDGKSEKGLRRALSLLLNLALEREWIDHNPMTGLRRSRKASQGFRSWTEDDIARFEAKWPSGSRERLALALLLYTGQRRSDVVKMGRQHVSGDTIRVVQQKTGTELVIAMSPRLKAEIAAVARDNLTFLTTAYGAPFTAFGFGNWFKASCVAAGLTDRFNTHGLRKAAARRLAEAGCSEKQIMAITGHKSLAEVTHYTAAANQERLAREAMEKVEAGTNSSSSAAPNRQTRRKV